MAEAELLIVIFAKPAVPGRVKTRLLPTLTAEQAAEFHLAALADTVAAAKSVAGDRLELHIAGDADDAREFRARYPGCTVRRQCGGDLGGRLLYSFAGSFARGVERTLILGSDHPTLPPQYLVEALEHLRFTDLVFGPSRDGGYYAVGVRRDGWPGAQAAFEGIPWSTSAVLETSLDRARRAGLKVALTPEWYDVDRPQDLEALGRDALLESASLRLLDEIGRKRG